MQPDVFTSQEPEQIADRMRACFEMYDFGVEMARSRLKRQQPEASDRRLAELLTRELSPPPLRRERGLTPRPWPTR